MSSQRHGAALLLDVDGRQVRVTSPDKPAFPGLTKADVVSYYAAVARRMLEHLRDRPTALQRWPDGVFPGAESFYQKHLPRGVPEYVQSTAVRFPSGRSGQLLCPTEPAVIVWAAQMNAVTFHPWPSRAPLTDRPDQLRLDFDPSPGTTFDDAVRAALLARDLLAEFGWEAGCKTSGGRGVHVYVPIQAQWGFIEVRHAAIAIARELERRAPTLITTSWWKEGRGSRVFIDFNQTAQDRTMASAYSVRPTPDATVSMPVTWDELPSCRPGEFTVRTVPALLGEGRPDPWTGLLPQSGAGCDLSPALQWWDRDVADGLEDLPYPPDFPKMAGEPKRVQPSRAAQPGRSTRRSGTVAAPGAD